jgi:hypothetical protein
MDTQSKRAKRERKIIQKTAPATKIYVDRFIVGQNSSFVLIHKKSRSLLFMCDDVIGKTSHCTLECLAFGVFFFGESKEK